MPPLSHQQLAAAVLMFHRPSRVSPMHDARRSQPESQQIVQPHRRLVRPRLCRLATSPNRTVRRNRSHVDAPNSSPSGRYTQFRKVPRPTLYMVEHTITGVFKRLVKTRGMQEPYAIVVLWAKSNSNPQSVATYMMKCLAEAEKRHDQDYPHEPITRPEGTIVTTDYEPATGTGQHQKAVFRFSISTSAFASYLVQMVPTLPTFDRLATCWHDGDECVVIRVCLDSERADAISARFNRATPDSQGLAAKSSRQIENHIDLIQDSIHTIATIYSEDRHRAEQCH
ncbi:BZ3501_MvSof-1269-A2-R1_Chr12-1g03380 [Microbotryum saponariae]|nr:BZ3501_MvSof-1269-A2-R1_Chr12-1g03380 [Microbotryum saponariae]